MWEINTQTGFGDTIPVYHGKQRARRKGKSADLPVMNNPNPCFSMATELTDGRYCENNGLLTVTGEHIHLWTSAEILVI